MKVTIPKSGVVPKVDVYFLADTTSSMRDAINAVKVGISDVLTEIGALGADVQFGVGEYKDFPAPDPGRHPYAFLHQHSLSANTAEIQAAIATWTVTPGLDVPEAQFYALDQLAEAPGGTIGWRADSRRIIVWFGDAAGHDAVCQQISGLSYDITEASVTAKLLAEKIKVLALSLSSSGAPVGLDDDPKAKATGYQPFCGNPGGTPGQGTRIAKTTGGKIIQGVSADTIVETIKTELAAQITAIGNVSLVASGATAPFVVAIAPSDGYGPLSRDQDHELSFDVDWIGTVEATYEDQVFSGSLDVIADGEVVGGKTVTITVPLDEEITMPRPDDRSGTWMLIHQVTGLYFIVRGYTPALNRVVQVWAEDPPRNFAVPQQGHLWVLVKQTDGTYLIQTRDSTQLLYLQAPNTPGQSAAPMLRPREETNDFQSWVLVPVTSDPDTYVIQSKRFSNCALGLDQGNCTNGHNIVLSNSWGRPTWHEYWRLTEFPANAQ
ncbi:RICIN domain-containing protein [Coleofasciculus sp. G2-EDA-02]|uniref:RICIN domain-containing protein n=1 Tax=Coleofasciculus sp. G2-EDA-02 TaxID=3069529 RepID=UPI0032FC5CB0